MPAALPSRFDSMGVGQRIPGAPNCRGYSADASPHYYTGDEWYATWMPRRNNPELHVQPRLVPPHYRKPMLRFNVHSKRYRLCQYTSGTTSRRGVIITTANDGLIYVHKPRWDQIIPRWRPLLPGCLSTMIWPTGLGFLLTPSPRSFQ